MRTRVNQDGHIVMPYHPLDDDRDDEVGEEARAQVRALRQRALAHL